eukprot:6178003-Pleurochrysis_carterae.AAC.1
MMVAFSSAGMMVALSSAGMMHCRQEAGRLECEIACAKAWRASDNGGSGMRTECPKLWTPRRPQIGEERITRGGDQAGPRGDRQTRPAHSSGAGKAEAGSGGPGSPTRRGERRRDSQQPY